MVALTDSQHLAPEEYLELEVKSSTKHEYIDGKIYAIAGTTDTHNTIALNLAILIRNHLRETNCRVYFADIKARLDRPNCFYYPDLLVTCDPQDRETTTYKRCFKLIVEVLSESTEAFDRGDKFNDYQTADSLEEYVLVNSKQQRVEIFRRHSEGGWLFQIYHASDTSFTLKSIDLKVDFADLYDEVEFETESAS
ncbi:MAG: Uma2 family endonuclease [Cyanobacteria bacterium J007]|jgi:Uma2 family endonuclease|nr:MAG: Uma2 family endonuclease [Cyanobacteria bacterium J007]